MNAQIQAYTEVLSVVQKYSEEFKDDYEIQKIKGTLALLKMQERFGIPLESCNSLQYCVKGSYDNWTHVALYGEGNRQVSYLDKGYEQPNNEWLYCIQFTCGAYIFGDSYPTETFNAMWEELKSYDPKYVDTNNHCIYFTEDKAKAVYDAFWGILKKYKGLVKDELLRKRKKELELELAKLNEGKV